jgi:hypothetical protein
MGDGGAEGPLSGLDWINMDPLVITTQSSKFVNHGLRDPPRR